MIAGDLSWPLERAESLFAERVAVVAGGRSLTYGELAPKAALLSPPVHPPLKSREDYTIVGKSTPRIDIPSTFPCRALMAIRASRRVSIET